MFVRETSAGDVNWIRDILRQNWRSEHIVSRGIVHNASRLPGFIAVIDGDCCGLVTYDLHGPECEIVTLDSLVEGVGVGTALINAVVDNARMAGCLRVWLVTTNDNMPAMRFYQKRDFRPVTIHRNAIATSRMLKPEIPELGYDDIPILDEIEFERRLYEAN